MEMLGEKEKLELMRMIAKEFLEDRLGIDATDENVRRFMAHILLFEEQLKKNKLKKRKKMIKKIIGRLKCKFGKNIENYALNYNEGIIT